MNVIVVFDFILILIVLKSVFSQIAVTLKPILVTSFKYSFDLLFINLTESELFNSISPISLLLSPKESFNP